MSKNPEFQNYLKKDGIVNEKIYDKQKIKLLFIAKEGNAQKGKSAYGDYRIDYNENMEGIFSHRIGLFAFCMLNKFSTPLKEITNEMKKDSLKKISFINIKKTGGDSTSKDRQIIDYLKLPFSKEIILKQIEIIKPNIVVSHIGSKLTDEFTDIRTMLPREKIIDFYHPSARISDIKLYSKLKERVKFIICQ